MPGSNTNRDEWLAKIEESIKAKAGSKWRKHRWSGFVKEVVWWLHINDNNEDANDDDEDTIDTAMGLIKYRIKKKDDLKYAAGKPPNQKNFREALGGEGVPPIVCDKL